MQLFETCLTVTLGWWVVTLTSRNSWHKWRFMFLGLVGLCLATHLWLEGARWQMLPSYVVGLVATFLLLKPTVRERPVLRRLATTCACVMLGTSLLLTLQFPIPRLPAPTGPYMVGTTNYCVTDPSRLETLGAAGDQARELFVEVWYPADSVDDLPAPRTLWTELYRGDLDRVSFIMSYLRHVPTHSYPDLPPSQSASSFPLILFNHGLQMFTAQNTLLLEHLASHGYVIVSIGHPYESLRVTVPDAGTVLPPFITNRKNFAEAMAWVARASRPINEAKLEMQHVTSKAERGRIMLDAIEDSAANATVERWVQDTRFVLEELREPKADSPDFRSTIDYQRIGVLGMSLGGAVAIDLCKADKRIQAGINIDGLCYGTHRRDPIPVPIMQIASDEGRGVNDFLYAQSQADFYDVYLPHTRHADFSDMNLVWPMLRRAGQLGDIPAARMHLIVQQTIQSFLDRYLKQQEVTIPNQQQFPELISSVQDSKKPAS